MFFGVVQRQMSRGITSLEETGETVLKHVKKVRHKREEFMKQAEKLKSCKMNEGWMKNDEGWMKDEWRMRKDEEWGRMKNKEGWRMRKDEECWMMGMKVMMKAVMKVVIRLNDWFSDVGIRDVGIADIAPSKKKMLLAEM